MIVSLLGALITLGAIMFSFRQMTTTRLLIAIGLASLHTAASISYYYFSLQSAADARSYYLDPLNVANDSFGLGTVLTYKLTHFLKAGLGGSYFACFFFFQSLGFWGIALLMRTFEDIDARTQVRALAVPLLLLCLPSLHFWTGAIGKDAPVFLGICLCTWAVLSLRRRLIPFGLGVLLIFVFRPHIALIIIASVAAAGFIHRDISFGRKTVILGTTFAMVAIFAAAIQTTFNIDITDPTAMTAFLEERDQIATKVGGTTAVTDAPIYIRAISLMFRPFFVDADSMPAMIASLENAVILFSIIYLIKSWGTLLFLSRRILFVKYSIIATIAVLTMLTLIYYNVGLGLRQRVMAFPPFLCILVSIWCMRARVAVAGHAAGAANGRPNNGAPATAPQVS